MFCPKCGTRLEEGDYKCFKCDWAWEQIENCEIKNKKHSDDKKSEIGDYEMLCKKCLKEIPPNMPFCIYCGEEQDVKKNIQNNTAVDKKEKNIYFEKFKEQTKIFMNKIKQLSAKTKIIIVSAFLVVLTLCLIISMSSNKNKLVGKWENGQIGYIIFTENGQFFVDNDDISGKYKVDGSTIIIYNENGRIEHWEFNISNGILTMTNNEEDYTMALYKVK